MSPSPNTANHLLTPHRPGGTGGAPRPPLCPYELVTDAADARAYPLPARMVDVGGHRLHVTCLGTGSPTVVIERGLGDWSASWRSWVQPEAARTIRVCAYDRAGMGYSEPGPLPRTAAHFAQELHRLLQHADIRGPYFVVGHSSGSLTVRVSADAYPAEVVGVVLIESTSPSRATHAAPSTPPEPAAPASGLSIATLTARLGLERCPESLDLTSSATR